MTHHQTILIVDHGDSFVDNIAEEFRCRDCRVEILPVGCGSDRLVREAMRAGLVVLGPGPGDPRDQAETLDLLGELPVDKPVLGICLGHQLLAIRFGGTVRVGSDPCHGTAVRVPHTGRSIFGGIASPMEVARYNSSVVDGIPPGFDLLAGDINGVLAMRHRSRPLIGLQFHPESILTPEGGRLIEAIIESLSEDCLEKVFDGFLEGTAVGEESFELLFEMLLEGRLDRARQAAFLGVLRRDPLDAVRLSTAARLLRRRMVRVRVPVDTVDICGTGGDGARTFNISTGAALVAAACGVTVAKHGNRSVSSICGSADLVAEMGLPTGSEMVRRQGFGFLDAREHHPVLRDLSKLRSELGVRTLFNHLGPLLHPGSVRRLVIGVARFEDLRPTAGALLDLGCDRGVVVHCGGCDELALHAPSTLMHVESGEIRAEVLRPDQVGFDEAPLGDLAGGSPSTNAAILNEIFDGRNTGPKRDVVVLNAAAVLLVAGQVDSMTEGCLVAGEAVASGRVSDFLLKMTEGCRA